MKAAAFTFIFALCLAPICVGAPLQGASTDMVTIPSGRFMMGSSDAETSIAWSQTMHTGSKSDDDFAFHEKPLHEVSIKRFKLSKYLVTRGEFGKFISSTGYVATGCYAYNGSKFAMNVAADWYAPGFDQTDRSPAVCVSYKDALVYIKWYSGVTGVVYRLPSEAEIEYATRAGTTTSSFWGDDVALQCTYANGSDATMKAQFPLWYAAPCNDGYLLTSPVGVFAPNPWGLYDMIGDVYEMTADCWSETYLGAPNDGSARTSGDCAKRSVRGGSFSPHPGSMRSASRVMMGANDRTVFVGFRLASSVP